MSKNLDVSLKCVDKNTGITLFELTTEDQTLNGLRESVTIGDETPKQKKLDDPSDVLSEHIEELLKPNLDDPVNHPAHYTSHRVECIDAMREGFSDFEVRCFCLCNCFKYLWRRKLKGNEQQDIAKALWYFDKFMSLAEEAVAENRRQENG